ncbi:hypothetical protein [Pseudidiomarina sediminum]|uniref:hypothetical protein n=1 Tax=Pseudidiomarina sediminum TaxID=431675 RepID=UPI001C962716|nr:hypothetical protein [Pseudidiomarina sediminum]MBY6063949.1 hypothetical protein [Pseudidiomarina sediminum]
MLNLLRARNKSKLIVTFALRGAKVHMVVIEPLPDAQPQLIVSDEVSVSGDDVAAAIRQLAHTYAKYCRHHPQLSLVLGNSFYQSVSLERPPLNDEELRSSLRYSLRDLVVFEPEDCLTDYYEFPVQLPGQNRINAVAASKSFLMPILQALHDISDNMRAIVVEEQAVACLFSAIKEPTVVVYQQPQQAALLQVYHEGSLYVNRAVRALERISELSLEEVRMGGLQPLSVEVQRSADYFERQLRQRPVKEVQLAVALPKKSEIIQALHDDLGLQAEWAAYPDWARELGSGDYSDFAALGGALMTLKLGEEEA